MAKKPTLFLVTFVSAVCLIFLMGAIASISQKEASNAKPLDDCSNPLTVTSNLDDGSCGSLRNAVNFISANPTTEPKNISFSLSTPVTITIQSSSLTVPSGTTITGVCDSAGPQVTLDGSGLQTDGIILAGNNHLSCLKIGGFAGRQLYLQDGSLQNELFAVKVQHDLLSIPYQLFAFSGSDQSALINHSFDNPLTVRFIDTNFQPLSGVSVTFSAPLSGPGATFSGVGSSYSGITNPDGYLTTPTLFSNEIRGNFTIAAVVDGQSFSATFNLTNLLPPTPTPTNTPVPTSTPRSTNTPTPSPTPTLTPRPTAIPTRTPVPTATPGAPGNGCLPAIVTGQSVVQACVSNPAPLQNSNETVYGRLLVNGRPVANASMTTTWHYKTTSPGCSDVSGSDGVASCTRNISGASHGYRVVIDVLFSYNGHTYTGSTSFTTQ